MRKVYALPDGEWVWDTDLGKWFPPKRYHEKRKPYVAPPPPKEPEKSKFEWTNWSEYLFQIFFDHRMYPGWLALRGLHDTEDQAYFDMLEELHQAGKMKVEAA